MDETVWQIIDQLLAFHQRPGRDFTPIDALNRLFARHVRHQRLRGMPRLDRSTCVATLESWTVEDLKRLVRWHGRARPRFESYPIVVVRCGDRFFVLDGNNRTNKWIAEKRNGYCDVIVIRPMVVAAATDPTIAWTKWWRNAWRHAVERALGRAAATLYK